MRRQAVVLSLLALVAGLLGACNQSQGAPQVWIDMPLNGSSLPLSPVWVGSHAADQVGIAEVELSVDDVVVANTYANPAPKTLLYTQQLWKPDAPGTHTLKVRARSLKGAWGQALATVTIGSVATAAPTVAATAVGTPTPTASEVPTAAPTPTATEAPTAAPTPTATPTQLPTATPTATAVPTEAPTSTPIPTAVPTVPAPTIGRHSVSTSEFYYGDAGCGAREVTIGVAAPGATSVKIYFRLAEKTFGIATPWASRDMISVRGGWTSTIKSADIPGYNQSSNVSYWFQFYFVASNSGGQAQVPASSSEVTLSRCTLVR